MKGAYFICRKCGKLNGWTAPNNNVQACKWCGVNNKNVESRLINKIKIGPFMEK